jgi:hypothetical protein
MTTEPPAQDIKAVWRSQSPEPATISLADVQARARKFERRIFRRNRREYLASLVVIVAFAAIAWAAVGWMMKLGGVLVIAGTLYIVWRLHRDGSTRRAPAGASAQALLDFHRGELVRQRDLLTSVWRWYLAPLVPGVVFITLGRWFQAHAPNRSVATDHLVIVLVSIIAILVFILVWVLNALGAARLHRQIDESDALRGD